MLRSDPFGDGYTERGFVAALAGQYHALRFSFRPALVEEGRRLRAAAREMTAPAYERQAAAFTAARLVEWDLAHWSDRIAAATLLGLPAQLFVRVHEIVAGWTLPDIDPDWPAETRERTVELERAAARSGHGVGEVREERDERNLILGINLLLFHPRVLNRSCRSCQTWMYDEQHRLVRRLGQPVRRPSGSPTPCWSCPKRSPEHAAGCERDWDRIQSTLRLFFAVRATHGRCLNRRQTADPLLARHLALVDLIVRRWEARRSRRADA